MRRVWFDCARVLWFHSRYFLHDRFLYSREDVLDDCIIVMRKTRHVLWWKCVRRTSSWSALLSWGRYDRYLSRIQCFLGVDTSVLRLERKLCFQSCQLSQSQSCYLMTSSSLRCGKTSDFQSRKRNGYDRRHERFQAETILSEHGRRKVLHHQQIFCGIWYHVFMMLSKRILWRHPRIT